MWMNTLKIWLSPRCFKWDVENQQVHYILQVFPYSERTGISRRLKPRWPWIFKRATMESQISLQHLVTVSANFKGLKCWFELGGPYGKLNDSSWSSESRQLWIQKEDHQAYMLAGTWEVITTSRTSFDLIRPLRYEQQTGDLRTLKISCITSSQLISSKAAEETVYVQNSTYKANSCRRWLEEELPRDQKRLLCDVFSAATGLTAIGI